MVDSLLAQGWDKNSDAVKALNAEADKLRQQRKDEQKPEHLLRDVLRKVAAAEKKRDDMAALVAAKKELIEATRKDLEEAELQLEKFKSQIAALEAERDEAKAKAEAAKLADATPAAAPKYFETFLTAAKDSVDTSDPEALEKLKHISAQMSGLAQQLQALPARVKQEDAAETAVTSRAKGGAASSKDKDGDEGMGIDSEGLEAAIAESEQWARTEAEKRVAEAGLDPDAAAKFLGILGDSYEEASKRRRRK